MFLNIKTKVSTWTVQIHYNLQNHPFFNSEERLVNLVRSRERFVGLSISLWLKYIPTALNRLMPVVQKSGK